MNGRLAYGDDWLVNPGTGLKKKKLYCEGHQAALEANLSGGTPRHIVEQEEALTEAPLTQAELHTLG